MHKLAQLLDQARTQANLPSDYALSKRLNVTTQTVSNWRHGRKYPGLLEAFALAELAGLGPDLVVAELELDRASRAGKALQEVAWKDWVNRLSAVLLAVFAMLFSGGPDGGALAATPQNAEHSLTSSDLLNCTLSRF
jgi:transcriptional regulator with XRE-family HTH domain